MISGFWILCQIQGERMNHWKTLEWSPSRSRKGKFCIELQHHQPWSTLKFWGRQRKKRACLLWWKSAREKDLLLKLQFDALLLKKALFIWPFIRCVCLWHVYLALLVMHRDALQQAKKIGWNKRQCSQCETDKCISVNVLLFYVCVTCVKITFSRHTEWLKVDWNFEVKSQRILLPNVSVDLGVEVDEEDKGEESVDDALAPVGVRSIGGMNPELGHVQDHLSHVNSLHLERKERSCLSTL